MIARLRGTVVSVAPTSAVVEVGGIGLLVHGTTKALASMRLGENVTLATSLQVREDSLTLFGFADDHERDAFDVLQSVSGIGPRIALGALGTLGTDGLSRAVALGDVEALMRVPGIGRKGAQRLVLELAGKLPEAAPVAGVVNVGWRANLVDALCSLGWNLRDAEMAADVVAPLAEADPPPELAALLRAALRSLDRS
jgi:holliday junction DNA helicase RuvA